jgi:hypothetical protein
MLKFRVAPGCQINNPSSLLYASKDIKHCPDGFLDQTRLSGAPFEGRVATEKAQSRLPPKANQHDDYNTHGQSMDKDTRFLDFRVVRLSSGTGSAQR